MIPMMITLLSLSAIMALIVGIWKAQTIVTQISLIFSAVKLFIKIQVDLIKLNIKTFKDARALNNKIKSNIDNKTK